MVVAQPIAAPRQGKKRIWVILQKEGQTARKEHISVRLELAIDKLAHLSNIIVLFLQYLWLLQ